LKDREILGRHRCEARTDARPSEDGRPVVGKIGKRSLHGDLPRVDGSGTKKITSGMTAASNESSGKGSAIASP
jgi:hypothetical protein